MPGDLKMGDWSSWAFYGSTRDLTSVRIEAHLSYVVLHALGFVIEGDAQSPARLDILSRSAGLFFLLELTILLVVTRATPQAVRYSALAVASPIVLMFFGYHELGYLSLTPLAYPLMAGVMTGTGRIATATALFGGRAAFHGFGLLSLIGAATCILFEPGAMRKRLGSLAEAFAYGASFYLIAVWGDVVLFKYVVVPGHAAVFPWRPWFQPTILEVTVQGV